ncbi:MAG: response regulator [Spirochaetes bacterium]|nr:response regulator [Spirochaetota bacterium]
MNKSIIKIIIAEDEILSAMSLKMELEETGKYSVSIYSSGEEVIAYFENNQIDLIIVDLNLSGKLDGIDMINKIREIENIPAVLISGAGYEETKKKIGNINNCVFLHKPVNPSVILKTVNDLVKIQ